MVLGLSQKEIEDKFDDVAGFADIGDFIDQPVKTYSSGMFIRLAFAVAVNVNPEILIVDEALAVGDIAFQHRCMRRIRALMDSGVTTLFVSHDSGSIKTLCNSAIMLHKGKIYTSGLPNAVIIEYMKLVTQEEMGLLPTDLERQLYSEESRDRELQNEGLGLHNNSAIAVNDREKNNLKRRGNRKALIQAVKLFDRLGEYTNETPIFSFNEEVTLSVSLKIYEPMQGCIIGFFICDKNGNEVIGSNTLEENCPIEKLQPGDELEVEFKFKLPLRPVSYSLTVAGSESYTSVTFDWIDNAIVFQVLPPETGKHIHALVDLPMTVNVNSKALPQLKHQLGAQSI